MTKGISSISEFVVKTKNEKLAYLPGEILRGELYIQLEEKTEVQSIKIFLQGEGAGQWLEQVCGEGLKDKSKDSDGRITKRRILDIGLRAFGNSSKENKIAPVHDDGRYVYEFQFRIPENLPPTFKSPIERDLGHVKYYLKAILQRPRKKDRTSGMAVVLNELISPDRPELSYLPGSSESKPVTTNCLSTGVLFLESCLSKSYYFQGETIMINATAENESTKSMKELYAKLVRRIRCKARFGTKTYTTDAATTTGDRIPASGSLKWKDHELPVPTVGPTYNKHTDIRVDYFVRVGMYEDYGAEIHLDLPVVIGTIGTDSEIKTRQEQEALEEYIQKQRRVEDYRLRCIKDEERAENRKELERIVGPFDKINIARDTGPLVENGRTQVMFADRAGMSRDGRKGSNRSLSAGPISTKRARSTSGDRSASLDGRKKPNSGSKESLATRKSSLKSGPSTITGSKSSSKEGEKSTGVKGNKTATTVSVASRSRPAEKKLSASSQSASASALNRSGSKESLGSHSRLSGSKESLDSNSRSSGSTERLASESAAFNRSRSGERELPGVSRSASAERLSRSGSRESLTGVKVGPKSKENLKGSKENLQATGVKPSWNTSRKVPVEAKKASVVNAEKNAKGIKGKEKSSLKKTSKPSKEEEKGDGERRESVASMYVYRGSVSSECDVPLAFSRSRSRDGEMNGALDTRNDDEGDDDLTNELMETEEGHTALAQGRPLSREGRQRIKEGLGKTQGNRRSLISEEREGEGKTKSSSKSKGGAASSGSAKESKVISAAKGKGHPSGASQTGAQQGIKTQAKGQSKSSEAGIKNDGQNAMQTTKQTSSKQPVEQEALLQNQLVGELHSAPEYEFAKLQDVGGSKKGKGEPNGGSSNQSTTNGEGNSRSQPKLPLNVTNKKGDSHLLQPYRLQAELNNTDEGVDEASNMPSERTQKDRENLKEFENLENLFNSLSPRSKEKYLSPVENYDEFQDSGRGFLSQLRSQHPQPPATMDNVEERDEGYSGDTPRPTDVQIRQPPVFEFEQIGDGLYEHQGLLDVPMSPIHEESAEYDQDADPENKGKIDCKGKLGVGSGQVVLGAGKGINKRAEPRSYSEAVSGKGGRPSDGRSKSTGEERKVKGDGSRSVSDQERDTGKGKHNISGQSATEKGANKPDKNSNNSTGKDGNMSSDGSNSAPEKGGKAIDGKHINASQSGKGASTSGSNQTGKGRKSPEKVESAKGSNKTRDQTREQEGLAKQPTIGEAKGAVIDEKDRQQKGDHLTTKKGSSTSSNEPKETTIRKGELRQDKENKSSPKRTSGSSFGKTSTGGKEKANNISLSKDERKRTERPNNKQEGGRGRDEEPLAKTSIVGAELAIIGDQVENKNQLEKERAAMHKEREQEQQQGQGRDRQPKISINEKPVTFGEVKASYASLTEETPGDTDEESAGQSGELQNRSNPMGDDQKKVEGGGDGNPENKKPTPWAFIGGAFVKLKSKLKPKQQNTEKDSPQQKATPANSSGNQTQNERQKSSNSTADPTQKPSTVGSEGKRQLKVQIPSAGDVDSSLERSQENERGDIKGRRPVSEDEIEKQEIKEDQSENDRFLLSDDEERFKEAKQTKSSERGLAPGEEVADLKDQKKILGNNANKQSKIRGDKADPTTKNTLKSQQGRPIPAPRKGAEKAGTQTDRDSERIERDQKPNHEHASPGSTHHTSGDSQRPSSKDRPLKQDSKPEDNTTQSKTRGNYASPESKTLGTATGKSSKKTDRPQGNDDSIQREQNQGRPSGVTKEVKRAGSSKSMKDGNEANVLKGNSGKTENSGDLKANSKGKDGEKLSVEKVGRPTPADLISNHKTPNKSTQEKLLNMKKPTPSSSTQTPASTPPTPKRSHSTPPTSKHVRGSSREASPLNSPNMRKKMSRQNQQEYHHKIPTAGSRDSSPMGSPSLTRQVYQSPSHSPLNGRRNREGVQSSPLVGKRSQSLNNRPSSGSKNEQVYKNGNSSPMHSPSLGHRKYQSPVQSPLVQRQKDVSRPGSGERGRQNNQSPLNSPSRIPTKSPANSPKLNEKYLRSSDRSNGQSLASSAASLRGYSSSNPSSPQIKRIANGRSSSNTSSPSMGRGRSPTKRETTHGKKERTLKTQRRHQDDSSDTDDHSFKYQDSGESGELESVSTRNRQQKGKIKPSKDASQLSGHGSVSQQRDVDLDSLDSHRSSRSEANDEKHQQRPSKEIKLDQSQGRPKSSQKPSVNRKTKEPTSSKVSKDTSPPKRIVCYYPGKSDHQIPQKGDGSFVRQSSVSSVDSLFSNSSGGSKIPIHQSRSSSKPKEPISTEELFNKEDSLAIGAHNPNLTTAVERQKYLDEMVFKSESKKPKVQGIVKNESPGFYDYTHNAPKTSSAHGCVKVSPKIMDSPARCHVTQSAGDDVVEPKSPYRRRKKDRFAHVQSPTKQLMHRPSNGEESAERTKSPSKRNSKSREVSPRKSRQGSPVKTDQRNTTTRSVTPKGGEKVPYVSPYRQVKTPKHKKAKDKAIQMFSYNPDDASTASETEEQKSKPTELFEKEENWRKGSPRSKSLDDPNNYKKIQERQKDIENPDKKRSKKEAETYKLTDKNGNLTTNKANFMRPNKHQRAKSENDLPNGRNSKNQQRGSRSVESPRNNRVKTPENEAERRRRSLIRQQQRDERLRKLRDKYNVEKSQFIHHALHPEEDNLSHSYPSCKRPSSKQNQTHQRYDHLREFDDPENRMLGHHRILPDPRIMAEPQLTQSLNNDRKVFQTDAKETYPGLSDSYDHLNFNYHSPYYRARSTPLQKRPNNPRLSRSFDGRELRETWSPSDSYGYVECRGRTRPYEGHIERLDKYNIIYNSRSTDDLLRQSPGYHLKAPYATEGQRKPKEKQSKEKSYKEPVSIMKNSKDSNKRRMAEEEKIEAKEEPMLGDRGNIIDEFLLSNGLVDPEQLRHDELQALRKKAYLEEEYLRRTAPTREIPPSSEVKPLKGAEKQIPKCAVQPAAIPYHVTMEEDYVPRSSAVALMDDDSGDRKPVKGKQSSPHHVTFQNKEQKEQTIKKVDVKMKETMSQSKKTEERIKEPLSPSKDSESSKLPAIAIGKSSKVYIPSIDNGEPYVDKVMQNTPSKLIQNQIMPYNFFPIICSSHLPKKVNYPIDMEDLSNQGKDQISPRSRSKSPERSTKVEVERKKRSRSHSPRMLQETIQKKPKSDVTQLDEKDGRQDIQEVEDQPVVKTDKPKKKVVAKKKKKIASLAVPSQRKSKVKSPRIVMREKPKRPKPKQECFIILHDQKVKTPAIKEGETTDSPFSKPPLVRADSSGTTSSHDERIVISGGFSFPPNNKYKPKTTKKKKKKTTSSKMVAKAKTKAKVNSTKNKQAREESQQLDQIIEQNNQRIAELQFFENISQIEENSKTLEEELREISRIQQQEREQREQYRSITQPRDDLPPRAVPQAALLPTFDITQFENNQTNENQQQQQHGTNLQTQANYDLDASNLSEKELIDLIALEISQHEQKEASKCLVNGVTAPQCGFNSKKNSTKLPYENSPQPLICFTEDDTATKAEEKTPKIISQDSVLGIKHLTRQEKVNKKNLQQQMKKNTIIATPIIKSGQLSKAEEHALRQRFDQRILISNRNVTFTQSPDTSSTAHGHGLRLPRRSKDDSYDSFEHHERYFGILNGDGDLKSNKELLDASYTNKQNQRDVMKRQRKNDRLQKDLEAVRHLRRASCPAALGLREGFSFADDVYSSDANTIDSIDGEKTAERQKKVQEANQQNGISQITKTNEKPTVNNIPPRSTRTVTKVPMGGFTYEEEVIETFKYIEDRPLKKQTNRFDLCGTDGSLSFDVPVVTSETHTSDTESAKFTSDENTDSEASARCSDRELLTRTGSKMYSTNVIHSPSEERSFVYKPTMKYTCSNESPRRSAIPRFSGSRT
ncbi:titin homolog [Clytia hemisphaerica]|uniref:Arrestin C-terminal-like domain-containing protein n=1 Tax=Clytia hemisphaerica TaxID=252671 RepID=A0A7M5X070_9CNID